MHSSPKINLRTYPFTPNSFMPITINHCSQVCPYAIVVCVYVHYIFAFLKILHKLYSMSSFWSCILLTYFLRFTHVFVCIDT